MRIDLNTRVSQAADNQKPARRTPHASGSASAPSESGSDQARLSLDRRRMLSLESGVNQLPDVRQERVAGLRQVVQQSGYNVGSDQIADAMISEMTTGSNPLR